MGWACYKIGGKCECRLSLIVGFIAKEWANVGV